ncbi:MAG: hypothetical protein JNL97_03490, partial [Verrucomicrobiales bacterium]|nr:hypothetical protein [Verrucomicrobiales bacterium]
MNDFILRVLGAPVGETGTVLSSRLEWHPVFGGLVFLALVGSGLGIAAWSYLRRDVELAAGRRRMLLTLRCLSTLVIAGVFLRPTLGLTVEGLVRQTLILLFDGTASLHLRDPRTDGPDRVRAALAEGALPVAGGLAGTAPAAREPMPSRLDLLRGAITNRELALIERLGRSFDLRVATFGAELEPLVLPAVGAAAGTASGFAETIAAEALAGA